MPQNQTSLWCLSKELVGEWPEEKTYDDALKDGILLCRKEVLIFVYTFHGFVFQGDECYFTRCSKQNKYDWGRIQIDGEYSEVSQTLDVISCLH